MHVRLLANRAGPAVPALRLSLAAARPPRRADDGEELNISGYVTEATVGEGSNAIGETVAEFLDRHENDAAVTTVLRGDMQATGHAGMHLREGDVLILCGEPEALERIVAADGLVLAGDEREAARGDDIGASKP